MSFRMLSSVINVHCLGKRYSLGQSRGQYTTLRESITEAVKGALDPTRRNKAPNLGFWALQDVSFEAYQGEIIGIIGRNGAGKSTLLKILSRITKPTNGNVRIRGRIASLLEVGTGFHSELTGRENVYLNGSILGMSRREVSRKFDAIVEFSETGKFIDVPVKRYSSGMQMRLAFAVAVHLEPEILVIDEVLAVGDAQFQKKCLERMRSFGNPGRTILFVSHNMAAVRQICTRGITLERGRLVDEGPIDVVVDRYLTSSAANPESHQGDCETLGFVIHRVEIRGGDSNIIKPFDSVQIRITFTPKSDVRDPGVYVGILTLDNQRLCGLDFKDFASFQHLQAGVPVVMGFDVETLPLLPGSYQIEVHLKDMATHRIEMIRRVWEFDIAEAPVYGGRRLDNWFGVVGLRATPFAAMDSAPSPSNRL